MRKYALSLAVALAVYELPFVLSAQTDSSRLDIGAVSLNKAFMQTVTIRGEDLEKMPFLNLSDAIRAWLFGEYTQPVTLSYVVDGNPVTDVNIYPIYEIETVTFINNAVAAAAYGNMQKELVLIATRRGAGKEGIRVAAQTGWVRGDEGGTDTQNGIYHQYYLGAYRNLGKVSFGVSADWQRDFEPVEKSTTSFTTTPSSLQRWKWNGRLEWRPDGQNTIGLTLGYAPERLLYSSFASTTGYIYSYSTGLYGHLLVPQLSWEGRWAKGLRNRLSAEYLYSWADQDYAQSDIMVNNGVSTVQSFTTQTRVRDEHPVLQDHLSYETLAGNWHLVPALDLTWQGIDEKENYDEYQTAGNGSNSSTMEEKGSLFYITPAVDLSLARALDIQAGAMLNASSKVEMGSGRVFPFVTGTLDLLHLNAASDGASLKLFGSYARRPTIYLNDYNLIDFSNGEANQTLYTIYHDMGGYEYYNGVVSAGYSGEPAEPRYWIWETGAAFSTKDGRATVQYSYERRNYSFIEFNGNGLGYESWTAGFHHVDLRFKVIGSKAMSWLTGINVNLLRSKGDTVGFQNNGYPPGLIGDVVPAGYSWTGGWVNRWRFGRFSAGLDVLYHLGVAAGSGVPKNTAAVPNIYAGYRFGQPHDRGLEVFIESRGLVMNTPTDVADGRRYYTLGGHFSL